MRQAPSTATESPWAISSARRVAMRIVVPSAPASSASTVPMSATSPVNILTTP